MCDPASISMAVIAAYGAYSQQKAQKQQANYQEKVADNNAAMQKNASADAAQRGEVAVQDHMRQVAGLRAEQQAQLAANGMDIDSGSSLSIVGDTDYMGQLDNNRIRDNASREAWSHDVAASNDSASAGLYKATADGINPMMGAGLAAGGSVADSWGSYSKSGGKASFGQWATGNG